MKNKHIPMKGTENVYSISGARLTKKLEQARATAASHALDLREDTQPTNQRKTVVVTSNPRNSVAARMASATEKRSFPWRTVTAVAAGIGALVFTHIHHDAKPSPDVISLSAPAPGNYDVLIKSGTVTDVEHLFERAQHYTPTAKVENNNISDVAASYSDNSSGDVGPNTEFTVHPDHPIVDEAALHTDEGIVITLDK